MKETRVYKDVAHGLKTHLHDVPIPTPAPDQVLIKVTVSGSNPKDWNFSQFTPITMVSTLAMILPALCKA